MGEALAKETENAHDYYYENNQHHAEHENSYWHVIWTCNNCEKMVFQELSKKGYELFLPTIFQRSINKKKGNKKYLAPMFSGYLFIRHNVDKHAYIDICSTKGLVGILGLRWDRLAKIPDDEIQLIRMAVESRLPTLAYPYLKEGDRVRIKNGSLANAEGILVKTNASKGLLVVSINLLQRSIAVEVDCLDVDPV